LAFFENIGKQRFSCFEITIGELVVLDPTLRDVSTSLLDQSVEPRKDKQKLHFGRLLLVHLLWHHVLQGSLEVIANARWSLISYLKT
jgi:hypothetical protein